MFKAIDCCAKIMAIVLLSLTIALNIIFRNDLAIGLSIFFILIPIVGILLPTIPDEDDDTIRASIIYMTLCLMIEVVVTFW